MHTMRDAVTVPDGRKETAVKLLSSLLLEAGQDDCPYCFKHGAATLALRCTATLGCDSFGGAPWPTSRTALWLRTGC